MAGSGSSFAKALGAELRRRRRSVGLSQQAMGGPLSRGFVSLVESGRIVPSLASLWIMASRLRVKPSAILEAVERAVDVGYTRSNDDRRPEPTITIEGRGGS